MRFSHACPRGNVVCPSAGRQRTMRFDVFRCPTAPAPRHRPELAPRRDRARPSRCRRTPCCICCCRCTPTQFGLSARRGRHPAGGQPPGAHRRLRLGGAFLRPPRRPPRSARMAVAAAALCALGYALLSGFWAAAAAATPVGAVLRGAQPVDAGAGDGGPGGRRPPQRSLAGLHRDGPGARAAAGRAARALATGPRPIFFVLAAVALLGRGRCAAAAFAAASRGGAGAALPAPRQPRCLVLHGRAHAGRALHRRPRPTSAATCCPAARWWWPAC